MVSNFKRNDILNNYFLIIYLPSCPNPIIKVKACLFRATKMDCKRLSIKLQKTNKLVKKNLYDLWATFQVLWIA